MSHNRINILRIPLDILPEDEMESRITALLNTETSCQICLLTFPDIMRAQFNKELLDCFRRSSLNIPITISALFAARWLKKDKPVVHNPFTFVIRLLGVLEKYNRSIYILGSRKKNILRSENNLKTSFPGLQIVGRYAGSFSQTEENNVILAVKKSSPALLLTGKGLKGDNLWLFRNSSSFSPGLTLWGRSCFEIFSGKKKKPVSMTGSRFFFSALFSLLLPWRLLTMLLFFLLLTVEKIRNR